MCPHDPTGLIEGIDNLLRERSLCRVLAILFQLRRTASTEDDAIANVKYGMILAPPESDFGKAQVVFFLARQR